MIIYTSGTTSRPKGAMHCHLAVVMAVMSNCIEMQLGRDDGITGQFPLFHCAGHVLLLSYLSVGGRMALMRGFDPVVCMEAIVRDKLTVFVGLSLMYQAILDHPRRREYDLSGLKMLHLHHGADGPPAAGARDRRPLSELRALQRPDRNVSGDHDVAAGGAARSLRQLLGRVADRQRDRDHGRQRQSVAARTGRRTRASRPERDDGLLQGSEGDRRGAQIRLAPHRRSRADRRERRGAVPRPQEGHDQVRRRECRLREDRGDAAGASRRAERRRGRPAASAMGRGGVGLRQAEAGRAGR